MTDFDFLDFLGHFRARIERAPHWQLKRLSKELRAASQGRYPSAPCSKVEAVERGFTEEELDRFMAAVDSDEDRAVFILMASLGLRVGELAALEGKDLEGERLRISGAKGGFSGYLRLPPGLLSILPQRSPGERLFPNSKKLRRRFALYRAKSGLLEVYALGEPGGRARTRRPLYRLSLHSLRHYAVQRVMRLTRDPDLARRFARHKKLETTLRYFRSSRQEEIEGAVAELAASRCTWTPSGFQS